MTQGLDGALGGPGERGRTGKPGEPVRHYHCNTTTSNQLCCVCVVCVVLCRVLQERREMKVPLVHQGVWEILGKRYIYHPQNATQQFTIGIIILVYGY